MSNSPTCVIAGSWCLALSGCAVLWAAEATVTAPSPAFLPLPAQVRMRDGFFTLTAATPLVHGESLAAVAAVAAADLGLRASRAGSNETDAVNLATDPALAADGYRLVVAADGITIVGGAASGVFYGIQTLRQAIPDHQLPAKIPCLSITDQPRFAWRGLMLDCSRTFQSADYLRKTIDRLACYKMNVLHLHLTEDEHELQSYFIRRIERHINSKGRRLIGWSEILQGGLAPNAAVMDWIGGAAEATNADHDVVMSPTSHCYFDYTYDAISVEKAYSFNPVAGLTAGQAKHILGLQANFWSHIAREPALVDRQLFPRLLALAERAWSPATATDWPAFRDRLDTQLPRLKQMGIR